MHSRQGYYPYGETRYTAGELPTDFHFTGQRNESTIGLYDYHARFYDPALGRFLSADTLVPDPANPQSLNRYSYVYNRPLVFTDSDGHLPWWIAVIEGGVLGYKIAKWIDPDLHVVPWDPPVMITDRVDDPITSNNMTAWLLNQMATNAQSDIVQAIRGNWTSGNLLKQDAAMQAWTALVGTGAIWDFKVDIERTKWFNEGERDVKLGGQTLNFDAVANMHFGFVGRAAGFSDKLLVAAAGIAQEMLYRDTQDPNDKGVCNGTYYCDHPYASWSIQFGIYLYNEYRLEGLDDEVFFSALEAYIAEYGEPPDPPPGAVAP
ncbi:MAG: RHS repeat-associated core domain-containing protein [Chloroflexota bacterium]